MRPLIKVLVVMILFGSVAPRLVLSQEPVKVPTIVSTAARGPRGGKLHDVGNFKAETVVSENGIQIFLFGPNGKQIAIGAVRGLAMIRKDGGLKRYRYDLLPDGRGGLLGVFDPTKFEGNRINMSLQLFGLNSQSGEATTPAKFSLVTQIPTHSKSEPIALVLKIEVVPTSPSDTTLIAKQENCPVMDIPLDSMGGPVKLLVGGKPMFLCCTGCLAKVQAEPAKYLRIAYPNDRVGEENASSGIQKDVTKKFAEDAGHD